CDGWNDFWMIRGGKSAQRIVSKILINDQKGDFLALDSTAFYHNSASHCIAASQNKSANNSQYVFIGSSIFPGSYPEIPEQKLYQIDCGIITDISHLIHPDNDPIGHVHSAAWSVLDGDGTED